MNPRQNARTVPVEDRLWVGIKIQLPAGQYILGRHTIAVSYPPRLPNPSLLPARNGDIVCFVVRSLHDLLPNDETHLQRGLLADWLFNDSLDVVGKLLTSIKLVAVATLWGGDPRQIGRADVLARICLVDGIPRVTNMASSAVVMTKPDPFIAVYRAKSEEYRGIRFALAIRLMRCAELMALGFHTEAFLVAFAVLDDTVQKVTISALMSKGLKEKEAERFLRGIKEQRLLFMLNHTLKVVAGFDARNAWPEIFEALSWINETRNKLAHAGHVATHDEAKAALYVADRILDVLVKASLLDIEVPANFRREIHRECSTSKMRQPWFPDTLEVERTMKITLPDGTTL